MLETMTATKKALDFHWQRLSYTLVLTALKSDRNNFNLKIISILKNSISTS